MLQKIKHEIPEAHSNKYFNYLYPKLDARGRGRGRGRGRIGSC